VSVALITDKTTCDAREGPSDNCSGTIIAASYNMLR
jgi:hypothetical protein